MTKFAAFAAVDANLAQGARDLAILVLFLDTGLRLGELIGLRVEDVHIEDGWLKVFGKGEKERIVAFGARARYSAATSTFSVLTMATRMLSS